MWIVTKRFKDIDEEENIILEDCLVGSTDIPDKFLWQDLKNNNRAAFNRFPHQFRLLTDDNEVCAIGFSDDNSDEEKAFAPLDDYGEGMFGCTAIEYFNEETKEWEML